MMNKDLHFYCFSERFRLTVAMSRISPATSLTLSGMITDDATKSDANSKKQSDSILAPAYFAMLKHLELLSRATNLRVAKQLESRSGKVKQRWAIDPQDGEHLRLVAGCVPILNDSRIILISSSSGTEWLVPKGGWEHDEELEEAAIRECFEEAGILGVLGPKLDSFRAETRKSKQRREEAQGKPDDGSDLLNSNSNDSVSMTDPPKTSACELSSLLCVTCESNDDATISGTAHTHVCMTFFPLYVQAIHESWPEDHRMRRAFSIEEAIGVIRPEFRSILLKIQNLGLHLVGGEGC